MEEMFRVSSPAADLHHGYRLANSCPKACERSQALGQLNRRALPEGEIFRLLEESGFTRVKSAVVPGFRFRQQSTQNSAEAYGVKAVMMTALKPSGA
jgi:hypothetical protein